MKAYLPKPTKSDLGNCHEWVREKGIAKHERIDLNINGSDSTAFPITPFAISMKAPKPELLPEWKHPRDLSEHHEKRITVDAGCFERVLNVPAPMTLGQYEGRRKGICRAPAMVYRCKAWNEKSNAFRERRKYLVDQDLVQVITDGEEMVVITCYHKHLGQTLPCEKSAKQPLPGSNLIELRRYLMGMKDRGRILKLKFEKDIQHA